MIYLYGYLGVGVVLFAWAYFANALKVTRAQRASTDPLDVQGAGYTTWGDRVVEKVVVPVLGFGWFVSFWPAFAYWKVKELMTGSAGTVIVDDPVFAVVKAHLLQQVSVEEVEACETVFDPLRAAPNLPFGHLNAAWRAFIDDLGEGDVLWSFSADWQTAWGTMERRAGYVRVREGEPSEHFLTVWKDLPQKEGKPGGAAARKLMDIPAWLRRQAD